MTDNPRTSHLHPQPAEGIGSKMPDPLFEDRDLVDLLALARTLFPHQGLGEGPYRRAVAKLTERAAFDPSEMRILLDGLQELRSAFPAGLASTAEAAITGALRAREGTDFFSLMRSAIAWFLYDDREVWAYIGYPGPSFENGGYLRRGFDDLAWLPEPRVTEPKTSMTEIGPLPIREGEFA